MIKYERAAQFIRLGAVVFALLGGVATTACSAPPAPSDEESSSDPAITAGIDHHTKALSMWEKSGGASGEEACWPSTEYAATRTGTDESAGEASDEACANAEDSARDACLASGNLCIADVGFVRLDPGNCVVVGNRGTFSCTCTATASCNYRLW